MRIFRSGCHQDTTRDRCLFAIDCLPMKYLSLKEKEMKELSQVNTGGFKMLVLTAVKCAHRTCSFQTTNTKTSRVLQLSGAH